MTGAIQGAKSVSAWISKWPLLIVTDLLLPFNQGQDDYPCVTAPT